MRRLRLRARLRRPPAELLENVDAFRDRRVGREKTAEIEERTVDVHVGRLRRRLSKGRERDPIRTVRNIGYAFDETFGKAKSVARHM